MAAVSFLALAAGAAGCSWIVGVSEDPVVVDGFGQAPDSGSGADFDADGALHPPDDAANADEDGAVDEDADAETDL